MLKSVLGQLEEDHLIDFEIQTNIRRNLGQLSDQNCHIWMDMLHEQR